MYKFLFGSLLLISVTSTHSFATNCETNDAWDIRSAHFIVDGATNALTGKKSNELYDRETDESVWGDAHEAKLGFKQRIFLNGKIKVKLRCQETFIAQNREIVFPINAKVSMYGLMARLSILKNQKMSIDGLKNVKLSQLMNMSFSGGKAAITAGLIIGLNPNVMILGNLENKVFIRDSEAMLYSIAGAGIHISYVDFAFTTDQAQLHSETIKITSWNGETKTTNELKEVKLQDALDLQF